ncbi:MAG: hypothetical protein WC595_02560 [Candidatus Nanoarchaeia archaeon]
MKFPIIRTSETRWVDYTNLSGGLIESLVDRGIIDPQTGEASPDHFELPIQERALLAYFQSTLELVPDFHIGCTTDYRPPSYNFRTSPEPDKPTFMYSKQLKETAFMNDPLRKKTKGGESIRDLDKLAAAFNQPELTEEEIGIGFFFPERPHTKYAYFKFCFDGNRLWSISTSFPPDAAPDLCLLGKDTVLAEIGEHYQQRKQQKGPFYHALSSVFLQEQGYTFRDVFLGFVQTAQQLSSPKIADRALLETVLNSYFLADKEYLVEKYPLIKLE